MSDTVFEINAAPGGKASSIPLMGDDGEPTIFEYAKPGRKSYNLLDQKLPTTQLNDLLPARYLRVNKLELTEVSERDLVGHFTRLTHRQYSVDLGAYPLGSCTMKYNPKFCDELAFMPSFNTCHPSAPEAVVQGWLELMVNLEEALCEITGMKAATLQPAAGAQGELTGLLLMRAWHEDRSHHKTTVIIPDTAHGTNPASVTLGGYKVKTVGTNEKGLVDIESLKSLLDDEVAGIMLTNPNTLGLFEEEIQEVASLIHSVDGLLYYDGANLNAILGKVRPGDMGFDIVHLNLHKTFATPHGGGGPGAGPVAVSERIMDFLPGPKPTRLGTNSYGYTTPTKSIGRIHSWHGNALVLLRAFGYILFHGSQGLEKISEMAVLNANWLKRRLKDTIVPAYDRPVMHEVVLTAQDLARDNNLKALDIAKALLDEGFHAPTIYFPLLVHEALMFEPTETESLDTLEALAGSVEKIISLSKNNIDDIKSAPKNTPVQRVDEALAARKLLATYDAAIKN